MKRTITVLVGLLALGAVAVAAVATDSGMQGKEEGCAELGRAFFAGGCFWCMEPPFEKLPGVVSVTSGYPGGQKEHPTYQEVSAGGTGHVEAVQVVFEPARIGYAQLLEVFWMNIDPTDGGGQFADRGSRYRSAIFFLDEEQKRLAEASKARVVKSGCFPSPIVTEIVPAATFYPAEEYHQDYYRRNPLRYSYYRWGSGRDQFLDRVWGKERGKQ